MVFARSSTLELAKAACDVDAGPQEISRQIYVMVGEGNSLGGYRQGVSSAWAYLSTISDEMVPDPGISIP